MVDPKFSQKAVLNKCTFRFTSLESLGRQVSRKIAQFIDLEDVKTTANELLKCLQELKESSDDEASGLLADVQCKTSSMMPFPYEAANVC